MLPAQWHFLPDDEYFSHSALGSTDLKQILISVRHWQEFKKNPKETAALKFGTILHNILAYPDHRQSLAVEPLVDRRTKIGRETLEEFHAECVANKMISVSESDYNDLIGMFESVYSNKICEKILLKGIPEQAGIITDSRGIERKIKPDWRREEGLIFDFKTTTLYGAKPSNWRGQCFRYDYLLQAAYYLDTANLIEPGRYQGFLWIAIEKEPPYAVCVHQIDDFYLEIGRSQYNKAFDRFLNFKETGKAIAYEERINLMSQDNPDYSKE